ncbi:MAG: hypothetical protein ACR2QC_00690 [Gammaproteobacteria bacterium]
MSKELLATLATAAAIIAVMWNISNKIGSDTGELRAAVQANAAAIAANAVGIAELRKMVNANAVGIAELRGIMTAHIAGHSHGEKVAAADPSLSPPLE